MPGRRLLLPALLSLAVAATLVTTPAGAFDADETFRKGALVLSVEAGGGWQDNLVGTTDSDLRMELFGAAGGSDLRIREIDSTFSLIAQGGAGASLFLGDRTALYAGYRLEHLSNAHASQANRGFEAHLGVVGLSVFFP